MLFLVVLKSTAFVTPSRHSALPKVLQALVLPSPRPPLPLLVASAAPITLTAPLMNSSMDPCPFRYLV